MSVFSVSKLEQELSAIERVIQLPEAWEEQLESVNDTETVTKLIVRHSGNELEWSQFEALYRQGSVVGTFLNSPIGSQYRDPLLHFYWHEIVKISLSVDGQLLWHFPHIHSHNRHLTLETFWSQSLRNDAQNPAYIYSVDIHKKLYLASKRGAKCGDVELVYFMLNVAYNDKCKLDNIYRSKYDNMTTLILFSGREGQARDKDRDMRAGASFELWAHFRPGFSFGVENNGFTLQLSYPDSAGVHFMDFYLYGVTDPQLDRA